MSAPLLVPVSLFGAPLAATVPGVAGPAGLSSVATAPGSFSKAFVSELSTAFPGTLADAASQVGGVGNAGAASGVPAFSAIPEAGSGRASVPPFSGLMTEALGEVDLLEHQGRAAVEGLMKGTGVDVHEAMIATEKAEMGFELVLAVRNKALAAYQQVMGMQF